MPRLTELSDEDWGLWRDFVAMHRHLARELDRQLQRDAAISQADFSVLLVLSEAPDRKLRTGELAELLAWEKSRVSHQVARMESRGLLERTECDTDGRGTWVGLTNEGRRTLLGVDARARRGDPLACSSTTCTRARRPRSPGCRRASSSTSTPKRATSPTRRA